MRSSRRDFLKSAAAAGFATFAVGSVTRPILGANDRIRVAVCGVNGRGQSHIGGFSKLDGVEVATLCRVVKFELGELVIANLFTGDERRLPCRSLVIVGARRARDDLYQALLAHRPELAPAGILSVDRIGDALAPGAIVHAVHSGHRYARELDCPPGTELYQRDSPIVEDLPRLYDDGSGERAAV